MAQIKLLSQAIDRVNAAAFWGKSLSSSERLSLAKLIASTHDIEGAYARTYGLSATERRNGVQLFTGEAATSAAARHISGEEACRALLLLGVKNKAVSSSLKTATDELLKRLTHSEQATKHRLGGNSGLFCCGKCSVSVWRHLSVGGLNRQAERLRDGIGCLKDFRDGKGRWSIFPFWYTVSALVEAEVSEARTEIMYASDLLGRAAKRAGSDEMQRRRCELARRALAKLKQKSVRS